jgi:hypothetical protein
MTYSKLISDERFDKYLKNKKKWIIWFTFFISAAAVVGFYINGETSSNMNNPESLYVGLIIGAIFASIALYSVISLRLSKTWDGEVIRKEKKLKKRNIGYESKQSYQEYMQYTVTVRRDNGREYNITTDDSDVVYNYYEIGDKVRRHKGLNSYEKFDKSKDKIIFCNACAYLCDIKENVCPKCNCPLLK